MYEGLLQELQRIKHPKIPGSPSANLSEVTTMVVNLNVSKVNHKERVT